MNRRLRFRAHASGRMEVKSEAGIAMGLHPNQRGPYIAASWRNLNPIGVVGKEGVGHKQCTSSAGGYIDSISSEPENVAIFDVQGGAVADLDAPVAKAAGPQVHREVARHGRVGGGGGLDGLRGTFDLKKLWRASRTERNEGAQR